MKKISCHLIFVFLLLSFNAQAAQQTVSLKIEKMDCPSCPFMIKRALEKIDGVESASVSMETKISAVNFDDEKTSVDEFIATTTELGFPSNEIEN